MKINICGAHRRQLSCILSRAVFHIVIQANSLLLGLEEVERKAKASYVGKLLSNQLGTVDEDMETVCSHCSELGGSTLLGSIERTSGTAAL